MLQEIRDNIRGLRGGSEASGASGPRLSPAPCLAKPAGVEAASPGEALRQARGARGYNNNINSSSASFASESSAGDTELADMAVAALRQTNSRGLDPALAFIAKMGYLDAQGGADRGRRCSVA
ncbi:unnamed protein product [Lampetra fluviatilis]